MKRVFVPLLALCCLQAAQAAIDAPVALPATEITDNSFTANWQPVEAASGYQLNVFAYTMADSGTPETTITESFEGLVPTTLGSKRNKYIDLDRSTLPEGWSLDVTGGSVRQPAAFCGVQGMKPSYGQISRYGIVAYASSLDQVGPIARNVEDLAVMMDVLAKEDPNDTTCDAYDRPSFSGAFDGASLKGKKVAVLTGYDKNSIDAPLAQAIDRAVEICREAGAEIIEASLPITMEHTVACYYMVALGDASSKLACYDGMRYGHHADGRNLSEMYKKSRMEGFGEEVRKRILVGTCILTRGYYENYFVPATKVRQLISDEFKNLFRTADFMICPITPALAYKRGLSETDPVRMYLGDVFTTIANLAGLPSISLNLGFTPEGLPTNVQLLAPRFGDAELLACASVIEKAAGSPEAVE